MSFLFPDPSKTGEGWVSDDDDHTGSTVVWGLFEAGGAEVGEIFTLQRYT